MGYPSRLAAGATAAGICIKRAGTDRDDTFGQRIPQWQISTVGLPIRSVLLWFSYYT